MRQAARSAAQTSLFVIGPGFLPLDSFTDKGNVLIGYAVFEYQFVYGQKYPVPFNGVYNFGTYSGRFY